MEFKTFVQRYLRITPSTEINFDPRKVQTRKVNDTQSVDEIKSTIEVMNSAPLEESQNIAFRIRTTAAAKFQVMPK